jgi:phage tail-like protein
MRFPRGLAVDGQQILYVIESGAAAVHVVDLESQRLRRRIVLRHGRAGGPRPVDVAATCCQAVVLTQDPVSLLLLRGRRGPLPGPDLVRPAAARSGPPFRVACSPGPARGGDCATEETRDDVLVLWPGSACWSALVAAADGTVVAAVPGASDLAVGPDGVLVVAGPTPAAGGMASLRRFRRHGDSWAELAPLGAPGYDGGAIGFAPDGRVAFSTEHGFGWSTGPRVSYPQAGTVVTYRLDSGQYRTRWGRMLVEACIPARTGVRARFLSSDADQVDDPLEPAPPEHGGYPVPAPDATPPLPSASALARTNDWSTLYRRADGMAGLDPAAGPAGDDGLQTYETPVTATPGRYLWLVLELTGQGRSTPSVRSVRIERPGHRLLAQLPRMWSRNEPDAGFLQRYLAPAEGLLHELDLRAANRDLIADPRTVPDDALAWLAGLVGLALDQRWPAGALRRLLAQAFDLFRIRGTQGCLERILALYLDRPVAVVERWRMRGLAGTVLGAPTAQVRAPAVGGAAATSGALGRFQVGGTAPGADGFNPTAHRFVVLVPAELTEEQRQVISVIVEQHKPAHTLAEICELGSGMRVGRQLHVALTSVVGPPAQRQVVVGQVLVGGDRVIGLPAVGSRLGDTSVLAGVQVG